MSGSIDSGLSALRESKLFETVMEKVEKKTEDLAAMRATTAEKMQDTLTEDPTVSASMASQKRQRTLQEQKPVNRREKVSPSEKAQGKDAEKLEEEAKRFSEDHPEHEPDTLKNLRQSIYQDDTAEEILEKIVKRYPNAGEADDALEFLLRTTADTTGGKLNSAVITAKNTFNAEHGPEITKRKEITQVAREVAAKSDGALGSAKNINQMFTDIIANQADSLTLFEQLASKYSYADLKKLTDFIYHSAGTELHQSSIEGSYLQALCAEVRAVQGVLSTFAIFKNEARLATSQFRDAGLPSPSNLSFETMAKTFVKLAGERYYSSKKFGPAVNNLGG